VTRKTLSVHDEADIGALLETRRGILDVDLLRDDYKLFDREHELDGLLDRRTRR
jgi:hypothetical protein